MSGRTNRRKVDQIPVYMWRLFLHSYRNKNNQLTTIKRLHHVHDCVYTNVNQSGEDYLHSVGSLPLRDVALDRTRTQVTGHRQAIYLL